MFANLIESAPRERRSGGQAVLSFAFHMVVGLGAVTAGRQAPLPPTGPRVDTSAVFLPAERVVAPLSASGPPSPAVGPPTPDLLSVGLPPIEGLVGIPPVESGTPIDGSRFRLEPTGPRCADCGSGADPAGSAFVETAVDEPARVLSQPVPVFPAVLRAAGVGGRVELSFVVDTAGAVESGSVMVVEGSHPAFAASAGQTIERSRFAPARIRGRAVRQLVRQVIRFEVRS